MWIEPPLSSWKGNEQTVKTVCVENLAKLSGPVSKSYTEIENKLNIKKTFTS